MPTDKLLRSLKETRDLLLCRPNGFILDIRAQFDVAAPVCVKNNLILSETINRCLTIFIHVNDR